MANKYTQMDTQAFGLALLDWHGGQSSALYAVGSTLYSGKPVHVLSQEVVEGAVSELRRMRMDANYPEVVTVRDMIVCNALADALEELWNDKRERERSVIA